LEEWVETRLERCCVDLSYSDDPTTDWIYVHHRSMKLLSFYCPVHIISWTLYGLCWCFMPREHRASTTCPRSFLSSVKYLSTFRYLLLLVIVIFLGQNPTPVEQHRSSWVKLTRLPPPENLVHPGPVRGQVVHLNWGPPHYTFRPNWRPRIYKTPISMSIFAICPLGSSTQFADCLSSSTLARSIHALEHKLPSTLSCEISTLVISRSGTLGPCEDVSAQWSHRI